VVTRSRSPVLSHLAIDFASYPALLRKGKNSWRCALHRYRIRNHPLGRLLFIATVSGITLLVVSYRVDEANASTISHVYFGTDTHSIGLFLGAALAVNWIPQNLKKDIEKRAVDLIDGIGVFGFIGMIATFLFIDESDPTLYKLAFPLAGVFGCAIITSIVHPASRFAPILSSRVAVWIGERSYAIYLWHWVVFQLTRPSVDIEGSAWALTALRLLIVFALADISLRLVELPIRSGLIEYWFKGMKYRTKRVQIRQKLLVLVSILVLMSATTVISIDAISKSDRVMATIKAELTQTPEIPADNNGSSTSQGLWVTGDSVILGIRYELGLRSDVGLINARIGRQAPELIEVMTRDKSNMVGSTVIFNLGNNNKLTQAQVAAIFSEVKNQPRIIVVNTAVPRGWRDANNALIAQYAQQFGAIVIDWNAISTGHPEYFAPDGVHLVPAGVRAYVDAITAQL